MLFPEEQPVPPGRALQNALFQKGAERREAHARAAHDDVRRAVLRQAERARLLHIDRNVLHEHVGVVGEEAGGQSLLGAAVSLITHHGDAQMRLVGVRLQRGGDGIQPRHHRRELGEKRGGRLEPRLVEFLQDVHVVAGIDVFAQGVAVIDEFHQPVALFALRNALGQGRHHLPVRPVDGVIPQQRLPERRGLALRVVHRGPAIETQQRDHFLHQLRRVAAKSAQRIARPCRSSRSRRGSAQNGACPSGSRAWSTDRAASAPPGTGSSANKDSPPVGSPSLLSFLP